MRDCCNEYTRFAESARLGIYSARLGKESARFSKKLGFCRKYQSANFSKKMPEWPPTGNFSPVKKIKSCIFCISLLIKMPNTVVFLYIKHQTYPIEGAAQKEKHIFILGRNI